MELLTRAGLGNFGFRWLHILAGITWYVKTALSFAGSLPRSSMVFAGTLANAALVGANTVNGPGLLSVSDKPA